MGESLVLAENPGKADQVVSSPCFCMTALALAVVRNATSALAAAGCGAPVCKPQEKMVTIILMQTSTPALQRDFENAVFQAIVK